MSINITDQVVRTSYEKWSPLAVGVTPIAPYAPVPVMLGEAAELSMLYQAYWDPKKRNNGQLLPSFSEVAEKSALTQELGSEIYELHVAALFAHADYMTAAERLQGSPMVRAEFLLQELKSTLEFVFDDGEHNEADERLEKVNAAYASPTSQDVMATALEAYWKLAGDHREALTGLGGFDVALIDEALSLAGTLRARSGEALLKAFESGIAERLDERNRLLAMMLERVARVRRAARYVFRTHPEIVKSFSSGYERSKRVSRKKKDGAQVAGSAATAAE